MNKETITRFNKLFNGHKTSAWYFAQGCVFGDERSTERPEGEDIQAWLHAYDSFTRRMDEQGQKP